MKSFNEFINESILSNNETVNNEQRRKELEKWLKGQNYKDYVSILNKMLDDPKARTLLKQGFGGELGDTKLNFSVEKIYVQNLRPTQSEIDVNQSVDHIFEKPQKIDTIYTEEDSGVTLGFPIITFRKNYIIDGHHRWSQIFAFNSDAKILCFNYDGDISPIQMLKATQGAIAAVKADANKNNGKIPSETVNGKNIFNDEWNKNSIMKYVKKNANDEVIEKLHNYRDNIRNIDDLADYVASNLMMMKSNNYPEKDSPDRSDMPQTDLGGTNKDDKYSSTPTSTGSALNKLKDGEILKSAVQ